MESLQAVGRPDMTLPLISDCCSPVVGAVMPAGDAETLASSLKAIADPVRLRLISLVAAHEDGEACVCEHNRTRCAQAADRVTPPQDPRRRRRPDP
jgi:hypothetical protein